jgi:hypothetical protein
MMAFFVMRGTSSWIGTQNTRTHFGGLSPGRERMLFAYRQNHYHTERNHQGLENRLVQPASAVVPSQPVRQRQRLGGLLNYYYRAAA